MWWHLDGFIEALKVKGFSVQQITESGHVRLVRNSTTIVLPMGKGDWISDIVIRHNLKHTNLNIDELGEGITRSRRPR